MLKLPLIDGQFFIDNSTIELLSTCPRALQYSKLQSRILNAPAPALSFGSALHLAMDVRYGKYGASKPSSELFSEQVAVMTKHFTDNPTEEDEPRNLNWAIEVLKKYNEIYHTEPFNLLQDHEGKVLCELPFTIKLCDIPTPDGVAGTLSGTIPINYIGRIDLPVLWDGNVWILDHKTTSMLGDRFFDEKQMSAQQIGYCWAFKQLTGQDVKGFCINAIRTSQMPAKPKMGIEAWWRETLQRQRYPVTVEAMNEWKTNTIALIKEFFFHYEQQFFPQKTVWCSGKYGKCQYFGVCSYPLANREQILASEEFKGNNWSPLKQNH